MRGVDAQVDGHRRNALISPRETIRLRLDLQANLVEVSEFLPLAMEELGIFWRVEGKWWGGRDMDVSVGNQEAYDGLWGQRLKTTTQSAHLDSRPMFSAQ